MTDSAYQEKTSSLVSELAASKQDLTAKAEALVNQIDAEIKAKNERYQALLASVNIDDACNLVMRDIDHSLRGKSQKIMRQIALAGRLNWHVPIDSMSCFDSLGRPIFGRQEPKPLGLLEGITALELIACLPDLFMPALEKCAREVLGKHGNHTDHPRLDELAAEAGRVFGEIQCLYEQRGQAVDHFDSMIAKNLFVSPEFLAVNSRVSLVEGIDDLSRPGVTRFDENGKPIRSVVDVSYEQMMQKRQLENAADHAQELISMGIDPAQQARDDAVLNELLKDA